jgi:hypothetical protein
MSSEQYKGTWQGTMADIVFTDEMIANNRRNLFNASQQIAKTKPSLDFGYGTASNKLSDTGNENSVPVPGPKGDKGDPGPQGPPGIQGKDGIIGRDGKDGKSAYELARENGFEGSEGEWLQSLRADRSVYEPHKSYFEFPNVGDKGTFYVDTSENSTYRWDEDDMKYYCVGTDYKNIEEIDGGRA